ncbi:hypothetical protein [Paludisphaera rhizosphaerae]|uniref:hypothetical protein n=1 Tax=Paludisphaera rhizosphaerae TaxID=2711216 RepID=UPI0013EB7575|nr:hypothetical protein [Paludisphaera rhizosphaerae]
MSRRKSKPAPESELVESEEASSIKPISGAQAVRNALAKGLTDIDDIDGFVRTQYGKEIPRQQISAYKSQANKKAGEAPVRRGRRPKAAVEGYLAPPPAAKGDGDLIDALRALKPLVAKVGADKVKELADLLS